MRRTRRRWKRYVTAFLLGAAVLAVAVWSALPALVERSLLQRLDAAGFADADLNVVAVGLSEARMDDVRLDANGEITAAEVTASYDLDGLMGVHLTRVAIKDLRISGRLDAGRLSIGGLGRTGETNGGRFVDGAFLRSVPPVAIESGRIDLTTTVGPVVLPLQGTVAPQPDGTVKAAITLGLESDAVDAGGNLDLVLAESTIGADLRIETGTAQVAGTASSAFSGVARLDWEATGRPRLSADVKLVESAVADIAFPTGALTIDATASEWSAQLALAGVDGSSDMQADLTIADPYAKPRLAAAVKVTAAAGAWIWPVLGLPQPQAGDARLDVRLAGPLPEGGWPETRKANPGQILRLIAAGEVEGMADIALADLAFPDAVTIDSAAGSADIRAAGGSVTIVPRSAVHAAATIAPALLRSLDLPVEAAERFAQPLTAELTLTEPLRLVTGGVQTAARTEFGLQLAGAAGTSLGLRFEGQAVLSDELALVASDGRLQLDGTLPDMAIGGMRAAGVDLDIDAALTMADDRLSIRLVDSGAVVARQLAGPPLAGEMKSLTLPLEANEAPLIAIDLREDASPRATYDLQIGAVKATAPLLLGGPKPMSVAVTLPRTTWTGTWSDELGAAAIKVTDGILAFPSLEVTARSVDADIALGPDRSSADVRAASIAHSGKPAPIVPLALAGHAEIVGDKVSFTGNLNDRLKRINMSIEGEHALATGKGEAKLTMPPLTFKPDGLQPQDVAPAIGAEIEEVTGNAAIGGRISWSKGKLMPKLQLLLQDVSFRSPQLDVLRLNGVAEIDSLVPFTTRPAQQMSAGLLDVGLPLTDVLATFRIEPGPRLMIETARLSLAGGEVTAPPVTLDLDKPRTDLALAVSNVDLAKLLELAQIEGLTATGNLGGQIPVTVDAEGLVIRDAVLAATGPGTLRYAPTATPSALLGGAESVGLALEALSNFQYTDLKLTVNRATGGDTVALMQVKGRNPDFYGGHAVEFNLNISGKLDQILNRGLAGYRIPDTIRDKLGDFAQ